MDAQTALEVVTGATHLFEEPGALDVVSELALDWFERSLPKNGFDPDRADRRL
jgi:hypothetical protein